MRGMGEQRGGQTAEPGKSKDSKDPEGQKGCSQTLHLSPGRADPDPDRNKVTCLKKIPLVLSFPLEAK